MSAAQATLESPEAIATRVDEYARAVVVLRDLADSMHDVQVRSVVGMQANELEDTARMWRDRLRDEERRERLVDAIVLDLARQRMRRAAHARLGA